MSLAVVFAMGSEGVRQLAGMSVCVHIADSSRPVNQLLLSDGVEKLL